MTVKFVTHTLNTNDITVMGNVNDVATVRGSKISRIGAVEGQEQQNPATIHVNFQVTNNPEEMLVLMMGLSDAIEIGLQLLAMGIEAEPSPKIDEVRDRLSQLVSELDRSLQVSH
ncbi:MAG: hypothetical protein J0L70_24085 [Leptolyngbya sp. UWPOB_LEPTO1]|uniref:hypothetical protein n=1 Tax=Leptolyngbya sp. UWPOB_LEPTO1 TaxID=2815653 RepID=UPI001AC807D8|nr:hypothetical protein [Leptolyngbya sp. UWPOB_LEPTO1]MBN8563622.1 hypothetical protein [Leptolyngbya sp. UWPOB_LEPTO1]